MKTISILGVSVPVFDATERDQTAYTIDRADLENGWREARSDRQNALTCAITGRGTAALHSPYGWTSKRAAYFAIPDNRRGVVVPGFDGKWVVLHYIPRPQKLIAQILWDNENRTIKDPSIYPARIVLTPPKGADVLARIRSRDPLRKSGDGSRGVKRFAVPGVRDYTGHGPS